MITQTVVIKRSIAHARNIEIDWEGTGGDFLSDAGFLNLEKFSATGKVQSTEIAVMAGHAPKS